VETISAGFKFTQIYRSGAANSHKTDEHADKRTYMYKQQQRPMLCSSPSGAGP